GANCIVGGAGFPQALKIQLSVWKSATFDANLARLKARLLFSCWHGVALMSLAACSKPAVANGLRVGLITPGSIADAAWNSGAYQGLKQIRDSLHLGISHIEARTPAEQDEAMRTYASQGYGLVFAHGFEFQDLAERVSSQYPTTVFILTSGARAKG